VVRPVLKPPQRSETRSLNVWLPNSAVPSTVRITTQLNGSHHLAEQWAQHRGTERSADRHYTGAD
jgi:hypothetical protein